MSLHLTYYDTLRKVWLCTALVACLMPVKATVNEKKNFYKRLKLSQNATTQQIKKSYYKLALKWHPDKWVSETQAQKQKAQEKYKLIGEAYGVLSKKEKRKLHDEFLQSNEQHWGAYLKNKEKNEFLIRIKSLAKEFKKLHESGIWINEEGKSYFHALFDENPSGIHVTELIDLSRKGDFNVTVFINRTINIPYKGATLLYRVLKNENIALLDQLLCSYAIDVNKAGPDGKEPISLFLEIGMDRWRAHYYGTQVQQLEKLRQELIKRFIERGLDTKHDTHPEIALVAKPIREKQLKRKVVVGAIIILSIICSVVLWVRYKKRKKEKEQNQTNDEQRAKNDYNTSKSPLLSARPSL